MTTENAQQLMPCPFCGGPAERQSGGEGESRRYGCSCANWKCVGHAMALGHLTQQAAIDEWNTRAPASSQPAIPEDATVFDGVIELAKIAHGHWDADRDMKVGKILLALAGWNEGYDRRADALHAARRRIEGE